MGKKWDPQIVLNETPMSLPPVQPVPGLDNSGILDAEAETRRLNELAAGAGGPPLPDPNTRPVNRPKRRKPNEVARKPV